MPWNVGVDADTAMQSLWQALTDGGRAADYILAEYSDNDSLGQELILVDEPEAESAVFRSVDCPDKFRRLCSGLRIGLFAKSGNPHAFFHDASEASDFGVSGASFEIGNLGSLALFMQEFEGGSLVVCLGFREQQDFELTSAQILERVDSAMLAFRYGIWPIGSLAGLARLIHDVSEKLEEATTLNDVVRQLVHRLKSRAAMLDNSVHVSIWLADFCSNWLRCHPSYTAGRDASDLAVPKLTFEDGLIGWCATNRQTLNVVVHSEEMLPGTMQRVSDTYRPIWRDDEIESELTVPMIYRGRLVGVLNVESPRKERMSQELVLLARVLAVHGAQAIHQQDLHLFYQEILGIDDTEQFVQTVVRKVGNFVEAPYAAVFTWQPEIHCLVLAAKAGEIFNENDEPIQVGAACYPTPGVGITRWVFDYGMYVNVQNVQQLCDQNNEQWEEIRKQVIQQWSNNQPEVCKAATPEEIKRPNDDRRIWRFSFDDLKQPYVDIPQPTWSNSQKEQHRDPAGSIFVPIPDPKNPLHALGVLRFSRRAGRGSFGDYERELLQSIASRLGQVIVRKQQVVVYRTEHELLAKMLMHVPGEWHTKSRQQFLPTLQKIRDLTNADVVVLRVDVDGELQLVASYPSEKKLRESFGQDLAIPKGVFVSNGGTGSAVANRESVYIDSRAHPIAVKARAEFQNSGAERGFAERLSSEVAVPLWSGDEIVGAIAAISFKETAHSVQFKEHRWNATEIGIQTHHKHVLKYHARWLGPALHIIRAVADGQRQAAALTTALDRLADVIRPQGKVANFNETLRAFCTVTLPRIAAHPRGLDIPQIFLVQCKKQQEQSNVGMPECWELQGILDQVYGATCRAEQDELREHSLDDYLDNRVPQSEEDPVRKEWQNFTAVLSLLPEEPMVIAISRENVVKCENVKVVVASADDEWSLLLRQICIAFGRENDEAFRRDLAIGITPIEVPSVEPNEPSVRYLLLITNKRFERSNEAGEVIRCRPIRGEMVDSLNKLCAVSRLATFVTDRNQMQDRIEKLDRQLPSLVHSIMEPLRILNTSLLRGKNLRMTLDKARPRIAFGSGAFNQAWQEFQTIQQELDDQAEFARQLLVSQHQTIHAALKDLRGKPVEPVEFFVRQIVDIPIKLFERYCAVNGIRFDRVLSGLQPDVKLIGRPEDLQSVVVSLLHNAVKAVERRDTPGDEVGWVRLEASSATIVPNATFRIRICVADDGIAVKDEKTLFTPYSSTWDGTGMGLAGSTAIVKNHDGELKFERGPVKSFVMDLHGYVKPKQNEGMSQGKTIHEAWAPD